MIKNPNIFGNFGEWKRYINQKSPNGIIGLALV